MLPGISIILPTYNRSPVLARTLAAVADTDRSGLNVEIVVIDNGSTDDTAAAVAAFRDRLPVVYLQELRPGKNCALNRALHDCRLRELVIFIDDDITPQPGWLQEIVAASGRWPEVSVFGAKVLVDWPGGRPPRWLVADWVMVFGFAWHDLGESEKVYQGSVTPMGPCFWIRREVLEKVPEFDETIGPRPTNRIMGGEASFLTQLSDAGYRMLYCPAVSVKHRISGEECTVRALRRRAYRCGRGEVHVFGLHRRNLFQRSRFVWTCALISEGILYTGSKLLAGLVNPNEHRRAELMLRAMVRFGKVVESLNVARESPVTGRDRA